MSWLRTLAFQSIKCIVLPSGPAASCTVSGAPQASTSVGLFILGLTQQVSSLSLPFASTSSSLMVLQQPFLSPKASQLSSVTHKSCFAYHYFPFERPCSLGQYHNKKNDSVVRMGGVLALQCWFYFTWVTKQLEVIFLSFGDRLQ